MSDRYNFETTLATNQLHYFIPKKKEETKNEKKETIFNDTNLYGVSMINHRGLHLPMMWVFNH